MRRRGEPRADCVRGPNGGVGRACGGSRSLRPRERAAQRTGEISMNIGLKSAWASSLTAIVLGFGASLVGVTPAAADVAVRCGAYGCDEIHCNYTGDRCYR